MSEPRPKYEVTLRDLRQYCHLLKTIEVTGWPSSVAGCSITRSSEALVGKNAAGEIVVQVKGPITPAKVQQFRNNYQRAIAAGILKSGGPLGQS